MKHRLAGFVAAALMFAGQATAAEAPGNATPAAGPPPLGDLDAAWERLLASGKLEAAADAYDVLHKFYVDGELAKDCAKLLPELDRSLAQVPMAVSMWRVGELCARGMKDEALAQRYGDSVGRIAAGALSRDSSGPWNKPIRVLNINDSIELVEATGMEVLYEYGDANPTGRLMRLTTVVKDEQTGTERHLSFDMLDALYHSRNEDRLSGYPGYRTMLRTELTKAVASEDELVGKDMLAVQAARALSSNEKRVSALRETATSGGLGSIALWLAICDAAKSAGCADGLIDALLPYAEGEFAYYRIELALAYARGIGIKKDANAATVLLDSADKLWPGNAYPAFAELWFVGTRDALPAEVMSRLRSESEGGSRRAAAAQLLALIVDGKDNLLSPAALALAHKLAAMDHGPARELLYLHFSAAKDEATALQWLERGSAAGDPAAMRRLAQRWLASKDALTRFEEASELMRKAAHAGDTDAMQWLGGIARRHERWREAEGWLLSAVTHEQPAAVLPLAELYWKQRPGLESGPKQALDLYSKLEGTMDNAPFRRHFSAFLLQADEPRDLARAKQLLLRDAEKGDSISQVILGVGMLSGKFGAADTDGGLAWIAKATAGNEEAGDSFAHYLYYRQRTPEARQRAFDIERALVAKKNLGAMNNLAWWLCTSEDSKLRQPSEGLRIAQQLGDADTLAAGTLDTLAACQAAAGEFEAAARTQEAVIARLRLIPIPGSPLSEFEHRRDQYLAHRAYIETRADEPVE